MDQRSLTRGGGTKWRIWLVSSWPLPPRTAPCPCYCCGLRRPTAWGGCCCWWSWRPDGTSGSATSADRAYSLGNVGFKPLIRLKAQGARCVLVTIDIGITYQNSSFRSDHFCPLLCSGEILLQQLVLSTHFSVTSFTQFNCCPPITSNLKYFILIKIKRKLYKKIQKNW